MARSEDITKGIIKLQALVRGYIVRRKFAELKAEYDALVISLEENRVGITWKTEDKPCLPYVFYEQPESAKRCKSFDAEKEGGNQNIDVHFERDVKDIAFTCDRTSTTSQVSSDKEIDKIDDDCEQKEDIKVSQTHHEEKQSKRENQLPDKDLNSVGNCNTSSVKDGIDYADVNACGKYGENDVQIGAQQISVVTSKVDNQLREEKFVIKEDEAMKEIVQQSDIKSTGQPSSGLSLNTYPEEKTVLMKLREDLTMELLWIQQAIESRKNYLVMKQNLKET